MEEYFQVDPTKQGSIRMGKEPYKALEFHPHAFPTLATKFGTHTG